MADLVLDACCVINLHAAGDLASLLPPLGVRLYVVEAVVQESMSIRQPDPNDPGKFVLKKIDLDAGFQTGMMHHCDLQGEDELNLFVQLAVTLDDGEAASLAVAKNRGLGLATDDRKARRLAAQLGVQAVTTPEVIKTWADNTGADDPAVAHVLRNIETFANFVPHRSLPEHPWWVSAISKG